MSSAGNGGMMIIPDGIAGNHDFSLPSGHADSWDELTIDGDIATKNCLLHYRRKGRVLAVASIYRDVESLTAELKMEKAAT